MADGSARGMPLLSGPPPPEIGGESHCRNCCKEFNMLFARPKRCFHCGYSYCSASACSGHQALMPKAGGTGYEVQPVCSLCIEMLMITASGKGHLRLMPLSKLRNYCHAYNIQIGTNTLEKDDLIDKIIAARNITGCLPQVHEKYFREHSVPDNPGDRLRARSNFFNPQAAPAAAAAAAAAPNRPAPSGPPPARRPPAPPPPESRPHSQWNPFTSHRRAPSPPPAPPASARPAPPPRPATTAPRPPPASPPAPPPPSLDRLLTMSEAAISALSIHSLKAILADNHVNARMLLEKADLVAKVHTLVEEERRERARAEALREQELHEERERQLRIQEEIEERQRAAREGTVPTASSTVPKMSAAAAERQGLCVVCQDEESCLAVIDCGHLCMCRGCSDLVMNSTRECPLCRTRIVSDARLLRIYRT